MLLNPHPSQQHAGHLLRIRCQLLLVLDCRAAVIRLVVNSPLEDFFKHLKGLFSIWQFFMPLGNFSLLYNAQC